jgi:hypothetical protein
MVMSQIEKKKSTKELLNLHPADKQVLRTPMLSDYITFIILHHNN